MANISEHAKAIHANIIAQLTTLVTIAFGLIAALAWNTAIQGLFTSVFGTAKTLAPMFAYAILVTIIAVAVTYFVSTLAGKKE